MTKAFDVVVVPDFISERSHIFEARTLFFLAFWLENAGQARDFPLHLACIGEPPLSVRWLAEQCNASITTHQPIPYEGRRTLNKLRGLEIKGNEDRLLLLDADVLILSDFSDLATLDYCIAAAPAGIPRVPERYWQKIYPALDMKPPTERIESLLGELEIRLRTIKYQGQESERKAMFPYYNAGIVFVPWDCGLRSLWEEHIRKIAGLFNEGDEAWKAVRHSDMAGFATSIQMLKRQGVPFTPLSHAFHASLLHIYRGALRLGDIKLLHAVGIFRNMPVGTGAVPLALRDYRRSRTMNMLRIWRRRDERRSYLTSIIPQLLLSILDSYKFGNMLQKLYDKHVSAALRYSDSPVGN